MREQAFQNQDQAGMMAGRNTLEIKPNHTDVNDVLAKVKAEQVDTAHALSLTALVKSGNEIADPSALVCRVYKLMLKELGVDPDASLQEIALPEDEEEDPHGDLDLMDQWSP